MIQQVLNASMDGFYVRFNSEKEDNIKSLGKIIFLF